MRLRDNPTVEVSRVLNCSPEQAWEFVTDIALPTIVDGELERAEWLDGATGVAEGARFRGYNSNEQLGQWTTDSVVVEVEDGRRWVWAVGPEGAAPWATWGFEVDPSRQGAIVRQWARVGDGASPFAAVVAAQPEKEGRIVDYRLGVWRAGMEANLDELVRRTA
ncbi:SRPBCC family protein [Tsukamurella pseudospumae]|uniref:Polyketide cyclase n=1 Tax=Tsukamurella pseudospumae TaxID=239498 RepID=A0A138AJ28_9ACTN|nr:SRPBCC family protein [Tsukamurella pseudospumae]KXP00120.1 polyketide cyclase [Tsukamurella pseudospumae]KXP10379.1 polyketide cyclase [Tsukamurella pseudospumae]